MWTVAGSTGEVVLRTALIYVVLLVGIRVTGKRQVGQLTLFDLVLLLLISNAVQNAMTGSDTSLVGGLAAAGTLFLLNYVCSELLVGNRRLRRLIEGSPTILIFRHKVQNANLKRERISMDELGEALREHGVVRPEEVELAVLEVDGAISVIRSDDLKDEVRTRRHFRHLEDKS